MLTVRLSSLDSIGVGALYSPCTIEVGCRVNIEVRNMSGEHDKLMLLA